MQWDFSISSDIRLVLKLPDQFNVGILRSILPEMVSAVYQQPRSLNEVVTSSGNSMRTIEREFREKVDCCPSDFLSVLRVGICGALLLWHHELSVDGIASVCGFCTGKTLRRQFKRLTGLNPSCFRGVIEGGGILPTIIIGKIRAGWDIPQSICYNSAGYLKTPIEFKVLSLQ